MLTMIMVLGSCMTVFATEGGESGESGESGKSAIDGYSNLMTINICTIYINTEYI